MRIQLCGSLAVEVGGRDVAEALPRRQGRLLLAYLVVNCGRPIRRDELIDVVWRQDQPSAPEAALSSLLTSVRRVLGSEALSGRSVLTLTLPPDAWIDVEAAREAASDAEAALARGEPAVALERARAALDLTGRPVLGELQGEWVEQLRAEISQLRCDQLETATRAALAIGDGELGTAERLARALIDLEPYRESGYALLMEALAQGGNVAEALRVFEHVRVLLRDELGAVPAPALTALHDQLLMQGHIGAKPAPAPRPSSPAPPELPLPGIVGRSERRSFVGREPELLRLRERWTQARGGQGELVLLTGEPGIGKTRLASRFAVEVHSGGAAVIYGRADEETVVPYQPFVEALRHLASYVDPAELESALKSQLAELRPLLPELADSTVPPRAFEGDPENRRYALFEAVSALLDHVARLRPLLLVVEDLHWADKPTLLLLRQVVRHAEAAPMMVLGTYRDVELSPGAPLQRVLADLRREQVLHRISLAGLDDTETAALVAARAETSPGNGYAGRLREYTAGNPFFIEETLRSIGGARLPEPSAHGGGPMRVPDSVQDIILRRFERLAPRTLEVLTCASVIGRDFSLAVLERLVDRSADDVLTSLEEAADAGLVVEHPDRIGHFSFCHALVRETVYARPAASRRERLHLRTAEALEAARGSVEVHAAELVHHSFMARHAGGAVRAVRYGVEAGREAAGALAYEEAAGHFERVLRALDLVSGGDDELRTETLLALGTVRWQGGEPGARGAFLAAAELARRHGDRGALMRAALGAGGRFYDSRRADTEYVALLEEALAAVDPSDGALRARLLARLAEALDGGERQDEVSREAMRTARSAGDGAALAAAVLSRHAALLHVRHIDERLAVADEAVALADEQHLRETAALARHWLIYDLMEAGDLEGARRRHAELERLARELQQPLYRHSALAWRGIWAQLAGRFDEAERLAREGLRLAERAGARDANAHYTAQLLAVRRDQGRLGELLPDLTELAAAGSEVLAWRAALPLAHLEAGERDHAAEAFAAATEGFAAVPDGLLWLPAVAWLAEAAAALDDRAVCETLLERLEPHAGRLVQAGFSGCWGAVDRFLGVLAAAAGRHDAAERHLQAALELHVALGAEPLVERTRRDQARLAA